MTLRCTSCTGGSGIEPRLHGRLARRTQPLLEQRGRPDIRDGSLRWYFQFTPHDDHDYDLQPDSHARRCPVRRPAAPPLLWANRNAFYYVLDRETGQFLRAVPFEEQTWARGHRLDRHTDRPRGSGAHRQRDARLSLDARGHQLVVAVPTAPGHVWSMCRRCTCGAGSSGTPRTGPRPANSTSGATHRPHMANRYGPRCEPWTRRRARCAGKHRIASSTATEMGGVLSTAGGLVFGGSGSTFFALDEATGRRLWDIYVGAKVTAAPDHLYHRPSSAHRDCRRPDAARLRPRSRASASSGAPERVSDQGMRWRRAAQSSPAGTCGEVQLPPSAGGKARLSPVAARIHVTR